MKARITRDGHKNVVMMVYGVGDAEETVLRVADVQNNATGLKLDQIQFSVEGGTRIMLGWEQDGLILPLEGRGLLNYYQFDSLQPTSPGQGLVVNVTGGGAYHLVLDLTKMGV